MTVTETEVEPAAEPKPKKRPTSHPAGGARPRSARRVATTTTINAAARTGTVSPPRSARTGCGAAHARKPGTREGQHDRPKHYRQ